ncbi:MAG: hypothetical protein KC736_02210 [Candidatus Moranbacteria bacterium]|nr:hypothetical protein [Candidatus Moranbacteria bacterium]
MRNFSLIGLSFLFLLVVGIFVIGTQVSFAQSSSSDGKSCSELGMAEVAGVCVPTKANTGLSEASVGTVVENFMKWILGIFGFLAVIAFVISGIQYLTAAGNEGQIDTAKNNMKWSIVGVLVALGGYVIILAIDSLLSGTTSYF